MGRVPPLCAFTRARRSRARRQIRAERWTGAPSISFCGILFDLTGGERRRAAPARRRWPQPHSRQSPRARGAPALRRALSPEFPAAALALFIPWRGRAPNDTRCRRQFLFGEIAGARAVAATAVAELPGRRRSPGLLRAAAGPRTIMFAALTHAREAPPIPASCATELRRADRPARAGAAAVGRRRHFFLADCCSQIRGDDGARPIGAIDDDVGGRRLPSAASYGVIATDRKICSTDSGGACSRSRSAAATAALNDHQKLAAYTMIAALTHAREAPPIPASCATELRRADRPARAGAAAVGRRRHFFLADCCSQISGRRWSSADRGDR